MTRCIAVKLDQPNLVNLFKILEGMMAALIANAIAGGVLATAAVWAFLQFPGLLVWAAFIGWASFFHSGGDTTALKKSLACSFFGIVMAWAVAMVVASGTTSLSGPLAAALAVLIVTPIIILASAIDIFSVIPATFYGFASAFAFLAQTPGKFSVQAMTSFSLDNVLIVVPISLLIGALLGVLHIKIATALTGKQEIAPT